MEDWETIGLYESVGQAANFTILLKVGLFVKLLTFPPLLPSQ